MEDETVEMVRFGVRVEGVGRVRFAEYARVNARSARWALVLWCDRPTAAIRAAYRRSTYGGIRAGVPVVLFAWLRAERGDVHWVSVPVEAVRARPGLIDDASEVLHAGPGLPFDLQREIYRRLGYPPVRPVVRG